MWDMGTNIMNNIEKNNIVLYNISIIYAMFIFVDVN